jgi:hypothetical protein
MHALQLHSADYLSGQRWCKQQDELATLMTAIKNRVQAWERAFWPGLEDMVGDLFAPWVRRWREVWYDPWQLQEVETARLAAFLVEAGADPEQAQGLATALQAVLPASPRSCCLWREAGRCLAVGQEGVVGY